MQIFTWRIFFLHGCNLFLPFVFINTGETWWSSLLGRRYAPARLCSFFFLLVAIGFLENSIVAFVNLLWVSSAWQERRICVQNSSSSSSIVLVKRYPTCDSPSRGSYIACVVFEKNSVKCRFLMDSMLCKSRCQFHHRHVVYKNSKILKWPSSYKLLGVRFVIDITRENL